MVQEREIKRHSKRERKRKREREREREGGREGESQIERFNNKRKGPKWRAAIFKSIYYIGVFASSNDLLKKHWQGVKISFTRKYVYYVINYK